MGKIIGLDVPNRETPDKNAFNIRPRKLAVWINALPRANLGETARQIFTLLHQTNQLAYPYQDRIRFLESMREPLEYVTHSMKKHFIGISLPLPEKSQRITAITKELLSSMAMGYKIALEDMLANNLIIFDKKPLAMLTHRSISYTGQAFLTLYQAYSPFSNQHWSDLHKLYRFAETKKLLKIKILDDQHVFVEKTTVATEYTRILLLSLASPYHLRQGEAGKVYDALERWLNQSILRPITQQDMENGHFIDNLEQAQPPSAIALSVSKDQLDLSSLRLIDTQKIAKQLEHEISTSEDVGASTITGIEMASRDISHDLMKRLLIAWGVASKRYFPRNNKDEEVNITIGLSAAHQFISHKAQPQFVETGQFTNLYDNRSHFESTEIKLNLKDPATSTEDIWGIVYPKSTLEGLKPLVEQELSLQDVNHISDNYVESERKKYEMDNWVIVNESIKGLMIRNSNEVKNRAQVGELVSINRQAETNSKKWGIGVIRWLKYNQDKSLLMGIEIINPNAAAIGIRPTGNKNTPLQRTLMLPELKNLKQPASLIINPAPWRVGNKITINMLGKNIEASLTNLVQNTGLFAQFQFEITPSASQTQKVDVEKSNKDFQNVWSSI